MRKRLLFRATCFFLFSGLFLIYPAAAQSLTPQVVASAGNYLTGNNGSMNFTIGQTAVGSFLSSTGFLTQGFQPTIGFSNPLPLDFLSFTANLVDSKTLLQWITRNGINTDYFEVQRSTNGVNFSKIAILPPKNPTDQAALSTYGAVDSLPLPGTDYYRIEEADKDGHVAYSTIVIVMVSEGPKFIVYPNPAVDQVHFRINATTFAQVTIALYDFRGGLISASPVQLAPGPNQFDIDLTDKAKGVYILRILGVEGLPTFSVLKE